MDKTATPAKLKSGAWHSRHNRQSRQHVGAKNQPGAVHVRQPPGKGHHHARPKRRAP